MIQSVLFVCLGNICRSPTAEALFREVAPHMSCDSAGTSGWHIGEPPYAPMQAAARGRGVHMSDLRALQFMPSDFQRYDLLLAMDPKNAEDMEAQRPEGNTTPIHLLARYISDDLETVPDPYYTRDFDGTLDILEEAIDKLVASLR